MDAKTICPECKGKTVIPGETVCNMEWRANKSDDVLEDCISEPEKECPSCHGTGFALCA
ncbi:hypothetical protein [Candidatus Magnetomonas plexicatena]|uniref:hypothetical protein n=1 Tax=Candidatus Magnetomonas plexicatena TaxID=2552947 RepID=UPI001C73E29C|nr:hypothetical protein E2O03_001245 [Nitrospirales bacterium LBB_01]